MFGITTTSTARKKGLNLLRSNRILINQKSSVLMRLFKICTVIFLLAFCQMGFSNTLENLNPLETNNGFFKYLKHRSVLRNQQKSQSNFEGLKIFRNLKEKPDWVKNRRLNRKKQYTISRHQH